jgi:hypothetical protein
MRHHNDPEVDQLLIKLIDKLCFLERETGRGSTLMLIPHSSEEDIVLVQDGKPLPDDSRMTPEELVKAAMSIREQSI